MKILAGVQHADSGEYLIEGGPVNFQNVREAMNRGITLIPGTKSCIKFGFGR